MSDFTNAWLKIPNPNPLLETRDIILDPRLVDFFDPRYRELSTLFEELQVSSVEAAYNPQSIAMSMGYGEETIVQFSERAVFFAVIRGQLSDEDVARLLSEFEVEEGQNMGDIEVMKSQNASGWIGISDSENETSSEGSPSKIKSDMASSMSSSKKRRKRKGKALSGKVEKVEKPETKANYKDKTKLKDEDLFSGDPLGPVKPESKAKCKDRTKLKDEDLFSGDPIGLVYLIRTSSPLPFDSLGELSLGIILRERYRHPIPYKHDSTSSSYGVDGVPANYAQQAMELLLNHVFGTTSCHRMQVLIPFSPLPSSMSFSADRDILALLVQLQFTHEGTRRRCFRHPTTLEWLDVQCLAMLQTDWFNRGYHTSAPFTLWQEMFERHQREAEGLSRWDEIRAGNGSVGGIYGEVGLKRRWSQETIKVGNLQVDSDWEMEETEEQADGHSQPQEAGGVLEDVHHRHDAIEGIETDAYDMEHINNDIAETETSLMELRQLLLPTEDKPLPGDMAKQTEDDIILLETRLSQLQEMKKRTVKEGKAPVSFTLESTPPPASPTLSERSCTVSSSDDDSLLDSKSSSGERARWVVLPADRGNRSRSRSEDGVSVSGSSGSEAWSELELEDDIGEA